MAIVRVASILRKLQYTTIWRGDYQKGKFLRVDLDGRERREGAFITRVSGSALRKGLRPGESRNREEEQESRREKFE